MSRVARVPKLRLHETVASVSWRGLLLFTALKRVAEKVNRPLLEYDTTALAELLVSAITADIDGMETVFPNVSLGTTRIVLGWPATAVVVPGP